MRITSNITNLAEDLQANTASREMPSIDVGGVDVIFRYLPLLLSLPQYNNFSYFPHDQYEEALVMADAFAEENVPTAWVDFLKEVQKDRAFYGCNHPIDLAWGVFFTLRQNPEHLRQIGYPLKNITRIQRSGYTVKEPEELTGAINCVLEDPFLRQYLRNILSIFIYDTSPGFVEMSELAYLIKENSKEGLVVDLGAGSGIHTVELAGLLGPNYMVCGLERQYDNERYPDIWAPEASDKNVGFVRGDMRYLPFPANSVDFVVINTVVEHITPKAAAQALAQALRILKPETGLLIVGPQTTLYRETEEGGELGYYLDACRFFRKERPDNCTDCGACKLQPYALKEVY